MDRDLGQHDIFVRDSRALKILTKVMAMEEDSITKILAVDKEFGMTSNFSGFRKTKKPGDVALHYNRTGKRLVGWMAAEDVPKSGHLIDYWKVLVPKAYGERGAIPANVLGPTLIAAPPSLCTQTYLFVYVDTKPEAESVTSCLHTRFVRFLISLRKITQDATRATYSWVPQQSWDRKWTDAELYEKYGITEDEQAYIAEMIREMPA
jgi:site-specific DNA-methyltransferase (adenine-specific)